MSQFDVLIRGATVVTTEQVQQADIGISHGKIAALAPALSGSASSVISAERLHVFPGLIDSHVHFNEPGRTHWEGFATGSRALAAGGGTLFFDMPLNAHPPTLDAASFAQKLAAAQANSLVDFAFWGGLVPGNLDHLEELADLGVIGFKAFMANSGIDDFPRADDQTLRQGMKRAAGLRKIVAVHAESEIITAQLTAQKLRDRQTSVSDYLSTRPVSAELDAVARAIEMAGETRCALHVVHVSTGEAAELIAAAKRRGVDVSCETCPHYLSLSENDMVRLGAVAKCAPPLRSEAVRQSLWAALLSNNIDTIGSDHSPAPADLKHDSNFFKVWGGISGVQHTLPLLMTDAHLAPSVPLPLVSKLLSSNVAARFKLPDSKSGLQIGADADLVLVDCEERYTVSADDLLDRHRHSPYVGRTLTAGIVQTMLRGQTVFKDGKITSNPIGRLVRPRT